MAVLTVALSAQQKVVRWDSKMGNQMVVMKDSLSVAHLVVRWDNRSV